MSQTSAAHPAVLPPGINLHVAAVVGILQQAVVLEEQPGALAQALALVVVILLDELLHQLEQTLGVPSIPLDQVLRWESEGRRERVRATESGISQNSGTSVDLQPCSVPSSSGLIFEIKKKFYHGQNSCLTLC